MLRVELAFYLGGLNLHERLSEKGEPTCFPMPVAPGERRLSFNGLYDVCLALSLKQRVVGNDVNADNKDLVIITGANEGGKSTAKNPAHPGIMAQTFGVVLINVS
jgi:DNA mismatch repair ATPase MutS